MTSQGSNPAFENITQRVAFSYLRQMCEFAPVLPASLSPGEQDEMKLSQRELDAFFRALYRSAYEQPAAFGLPTADDISVAQGDGKEHKQAVTKQVKKARDKLVTGVDYLYYIGRKGMLVESRLRLAQDDYAAFFAKSPRVKQELVKGMQGIGLVVSEQEDAVRVSNTRYPSMMPALQTLAQVCAQRADDKLAALLFARCDFRALDVGYRPDTLDLLQTALSPAEYERAAQVHRALAEMAYKTSVEIAGVHNWRVRYQGDRAIKGTALVEFEYDEREQHPLCLRVKCAATNRLVPLLSHQSALLQQDFFRHAHTCGAPKCSWCKTRKGLNPSVLERDGEKRTICWWMQRRFVEFDDQTVDLVKQYSLLHETLLAA